MREKRIFREESFYYIKQCFTGWLYWGKVWSRGKTDYRLAWNVSEYIPLPNY